MDKKEKFQKWVRILTAPPFMALAMLGILFHVRPTVFGGLGNYLLAVLFLTLFPLLAYPLQPVFPHFKDKGREGQRRLAIWMSATGYIIGTATAYICCVSFELKRIYLIYLFSGMLMLLFNKLIGIKASGHACGVVGPVVCLFYSIGWPALIGLLVLAATCIASLGMKRHTWEELIVGTAIPILAAWTLWAWSLFRFLCKII